MRIETEPFKDYIRKLEGLRSTIRLAAKQEVNRIADRHLARCKKNTNVGDSPDSPTLRNHWDRSGVHELTDGFAAEVFNPTEYAAYYEYGHRQTPGRVVFIELRAGGQKYGIPARKMTKGPHAGKWGIYLKLKKSYVKGAFVMTDSEKKAQKELNAAVKRLEQKIREALA